MKIKLGASVTQALECGLWTIPPPPYTHLNPEGSISLWGMVRGRDCIFLILQILDFNDFCTFLSFFLSFLKLLLSCLSTELVFSGNSCWLKSTSSFSIYIHLCWHFFFWGWNLRVTVNELKALMGQVREQNPDYGLPSLKRNMAVPTVWSDLGEFPLFSRRDSWRKV